MTNTDHSTAVSGAETSVVVSELQKLQDWLREPDHAEHFGTSQISKWINRRPTHVVPAALSRLTSTPQAASADTVAAILKAWLTDVQRAAIKGAIHISGGWVLTTEYENHRDVIEDLPEAITDPVSGLFTPLGDAIRLVLVGEKPQ